MITEYITVASVQEGDLDHVNLKTEVMHYEGHLPIDWADPEAIVSTHQDGVHLLILNTLGDPHYATVFFRQLAKEYGVGLYIESYEFCTETLLNAEYIQVDIFSAGEKE